MRSRLKAMADKPPKDEPGVQVRFERGISNALLTPPKPHKAKLESKTKKKPPALGAESSVKPNAGPYRFHLLLGGRAHIQMGDTARAKQFWLTTPAGQFR